MKKYIVIVLFIIPTTLTAQWFWQYPKPQGNTLRDIFIFDSTTAIAVGDLGTVIKTYDGGESWSVQHHAGGTDIDLYSVHFTDSLNGWAAGGIWYENKNVLLKTTDAGRNWIEVPTKTDLPLNAVYFVDTDTGIVVGEDGIVLRTTDGGISWDTRKMDNYLGYYLDIFRLLAITFTDANNGWIVGAGYYGNQIYKTTDCGRTWLWNEQIITPKFYGGIYDICFVDKNNAFIVGDLGCFARTKDGGISWEYQNLWEKYQKEEYQYFYSTSFVDSLKGWIVGAGFILETADGGENWSEIQAEQQFGNVFYKIRFANNNVNAVRTGWSLGGYGTIYKTTDTGESWVAQRDEKYNFRSIYILDENIGWAVGDNGIIMHTVNSGMNWQRQNKDDSLILYSIFAIDSENVISVGGVLNEQGFIKNALVISSSDGGTTWLTNVFTDIILFTSTYFINDSTGWIVGSDGTLLKTIDKGNTWDVFASNLGTVLDRIQFIDNNTGWISYYMGNSMLKTTNGGLSWDVKFIDSSLSMYSFHFVDANNGWAVGSYDWGSKIFKTTDGGDSWIKSGNPPISDYSAVYFINENVGWAAGGFRIGSWLRGTIIKTTNGGNDWIDQKCPSTIPPSNIFFINENTGWIVGDDIFKTDNGGGVVSVKDEWQNEKNVPETFHLYQNYPNPFNPSTTISFTLPVESDVQITIYDLTGSIVKTFILNSQSAGYKTAVWDGKNDYGESVSSGVYIYTIKTVSLEGDGRSFTKSSKLMLMK